MKDRLERERVREELRHLREVENALPECCGVLLCDKIRECVEQFQLIDPFDPEKLRAASYELSIGDTVWTGGRYIHLEDKPGKRSFEIRPFEVAIIKIRERLNLPRNMIGRWNIKVSRAYQGLVWAGGPQVDPGWVGHLHCPVYNLSSQPVQLSMGDPIAVIDFVLTTPYRESSSDKKFPRPPKRVVTDGYSRFESALAKNLSSRVSDLERRMQGFVTLAYTIMAVLLAVVSVLVTSEAMGGKIATWVGVLITVVAFAILAPWIHGRR